MSVSQVYMFVNSFIFSIFVCKRNLKGYGRRVRRTVVIMRRQYLMTRGPINQSYTTTEGYDDHPRFTSWSRGCKISWPGGQLNLILRRRMLYRLRNVDLSHRPEIADEIPWSLTFGPGDMFGGTYPGDLSQADRWYLTKSNLSLTVERF